MSKSVQITLDGKKEPSKLCFECMENERDLNIYAKVKIVTNPKIKLEELLEKKLASLTIDGKIAFCSQDCMGNWFSSIINRILECEKKR